MSGKADWIARVLAVISVLFNGYVFIRERRRRLKWERENPIRYEDSR